MIELEIKAEFPAVHAKLPRSLYSRLAQEAYRRAAEKEVDKIARNWGMYSQVEKIAKEVGLLCSGASDSDAVLKGILLHNGIALK